MVHVYFQMALLKKSLYRIVLWRFLDTEWFKIKKMYIFPLVGVILKYQFIRIAQFMPKKYSINFKI